MNPMLSRSLAEGEIVLGCRGVTKEFSVAGHRITAVDDISLDFPASSALAVVGSPAPGSPPSPACSCA